MGKNEGESKILGWTGKTRDSVYSFENIKQSTKLREERTEANKTNNKSKNPNKQTHIRQRDRKRKMKQTRRKKQYWSSSGVCSSVAVSERDPRSALGWGTVGWALGAILPSRCMGWSQSFTQQPSECYCVAHPLLTLSLPSSLGCYGNHRLLSRLLPVHSWLLPVPAQPPLLYFPCYICCTTCCGVQRGAICCCRHRNSPRLLSPTSLSSPAGNVLTSHYSATVQHCLNLTCWGLYLQSLPVAQDRSRCSVQHIHHHCLGL